ncbi:hypothetical protein HML84_15055 [Alcanivorax sp. IO_7]|nr:hypothetical protein HML84_15055 [Alcanivorax sp. IO_7]
MSAARQQGQSMAGFLVASMFILVPTFIALSFLAKTGDMKFRAHEASRYSAWEKPCGMVAKVTPKGIRNWAGKCATGSSAAPRL